jgi:uncharacterized protein (DUF3820 family)
MFYGRQWVHRSTYQCEWIAQQHKARGVVGQLVGYILEVGVDGIVFGQYLKRLLVDLIWLVGISPISSASQQR